ncbi:MAG: ROK family protein, partial [Planctomycetota bacterium]|nr:ROK family protein [Planctomycetota bacterium]
ERPGIQTLGLGISMPGLIDYRRQRGILSPNVPITNGKSPARDLARELGFPSVMLQETHSLCVAERHYGESEGLDDFAMLDVGTGLGLAVMMGGRVLTGHSGLAGEIGHIPREHNGRLCGCGRRGCLETVASESALSWLVSKRIGREVGIDEVAELVQQGELSVRQELQQLLPHLGFALSIVIGLFNPSVLFVSGRLLELDDGLFDELLAETRRRTLEPSFVDCRIVQARVSKRQGAIAGIIEFLTDSLVPGMDALFG